MVSLLFNIDRIQERSEEGGGVNQTDQIPLPSQLPDASFWVLHYSILMINRIHYFHMLRKHLEAVKKLDQTPDNVIISKGKGKSKATVDHENQEIPGITKPVRLVENLLKYNFKDKKLLEEALTHPSYTGSASYERLEFLGDAAIRLAISSYLFMFYPGIDEGKLSLLRDANVSNERLARIAVRHQLYKYVHCNGNTLGENVREFVMAVQQEEEPELYGGLIKAPTILADIVESVAAAVYVDCNFDSKAMWMIIRDLLEPIVKLDMLERKPHPVTMLYHQCQKNGKQVDITYEKNIASVYVDGCFVASAYSAQREIARLHAAKAALHKLPYGSSDMKMVNTFSQFNRDNEVEGAKHKLHNLCDKKKWPKPNYKVQKEVGRAHERKYICSVEIEIEITERVLFVKGNEKARVKEAEISAASAMLLLLQESQYL